MTIRLGSERSPVSAFGLPTLNRTQIYLGEDELELLDLASQETGARSAGALAQRHRRAHSGIDDVDYLTAATALLLEADLLATNVRHFPMIRGLEPRTEVLKRPPPRRSRVDLR